MNAAGRTPATLPERLTLDTVAAIHARWSGREAEVGELDLSAVHELDSAGVALLQWLRARQHALGLAPSPVRADANGRYLALCRAHRVEDMAG